MAPPLAPGSTPASSSSPLFSACLRLPEQLPEAGRCSSRLRGKRDKKIYFVMNPISEVINFMQTSKDESKKFYKL